MALTYYIRSWDPRSTYPTNPQEGDICYTITLDQTWAPVGGVKDENILKKEIYQSGAWVEQGGGGGGDYLKMEITANVPDGALIYPNSAERIYDALYYENGTIRTIAGNSAFPCPNSFTLVGTTCMQMPDLEFNPYAISLTFNITSHDSVSDTYTVSMSFDDETVTFEYLEDENSYFLEAYSDEPKTIHATLTAT